MPRQNGGFGQIHQYIRHTVDGVPCRHCGKDFVTSNYEKNAREHVRNHVQQGDIVFEPESDNEPSDPDSSGEFNVA